MATDDFFDEPKEHSKVKTTIVSKYFKAWAGVMIAALRRFGRQEKIAYIDLFSGPGRYEDGTPSTPLEILQIAIENENYRKTLATYFNDSNLEFSKQLEKEIESLPGVESLTFKPIINSGEVSEEVPKLPENISLVPTLFFVDPWGYKGLSLRLLNSVLKNWGNDCIFFFNYNRINPGLSNPVVKEHMDGLFSEKRADALREKVRKLSPHKRELVILEEFCQAIKSGTSSKYVLRFPFKDEKGARTSHYLIFVSKHHLGYGIMKTIMAKESSDTEEGVASFEYNPATTLQPFLPGHFSPLEELGNTLLEEFAGQTISMKEIYMQHDIRTNYTSTNYKDALNLLEKVGEIIADPPANIRPLRLGKATFADTTLVTFPPLKGK